MSRLEDFKAKWDESLVVQEQGNLEQRDALRTQAKAIAQLHTKENEERLIILYGHLTEDELVSQVTFLRSQGRDAEVTELTMFIMASFAPKVIKGSMGPRPRIIRAARDGN